MHLNRRPVVSPLELDVHRAGAHAYPAQLDPLEELRQPWTLQREPARGTSMAAVERSFSTLPFTHLARREGRRGSLLREAPSRWRTASQR